VKTLALVLVGLVLLGGCGSDDEPSAPSSATGPGLSIEEAIASDLEGPLLVNGNLLVEGREVRLCSALAESFPPQCGGPSLRVEGLDVAQMPNLMTAGEVSWTDRPVQLLGAVKNGILTVSGHATA
jgi:hypothetical protein